MSKRKEPKNNTYTVITDAIVELLEKGCVPWRQPWFENDRSLHYCVATLDSAFLRTIGTPTLLTGVTPCPAGFFRPQVAEMRKAQ